MCRTGEHQQRRLINPHFRLGLVFRRNLMRHHTPNAFARRAFGLRHSAQLMADEIIRLPIDIHINAIAEEVVMIDPKTVWRNQRANGRLLSRCWVLQGAGKDAFHGINTGGDQANTQAPILLENVVLEIVVIANG